MKLPYSVEVADRYGVFASFRAETFEEIVEAYRQFEETYHGRERAYSFANIDCADIDSNGLTEDEREKLEELT